MEMIMAKELRALAEAKVIDCVNEAIVACRAEALRGHFSASIFVGKLAEHNKNILKTLMSMAGYDLEFYYNGEWLRLHWDKAE